MYGSPQRREKIWLATRVIPPEPRASVNALSDLGKSSTMVVRSQLDLSTHCREITVACHQGLPSSTGHPREQDVNRPHRPAGFGQTSLKEAGLSRVLVRQHYDVEALDEGLDLPDFLFAARRTSRTEPQLEEGRGRQVEALP